MATKRKRKKSRKALVLACDKAWRELVLARAGNRCELCGRGGRLEAHHLIRRDRRFFRHNRENGIALCYQCHTGNAKASAHGTPWWFEEEIKRRWPDRYAWWDKNRYAVLPQVKLHYETILTGLREQLARRGKEKT